MRSPYGRQRCRRLEMRAITATLTLKPLMDQTRGERQEAEDEFYASLAED